jgi:hypothetical protein
VIIFCRVPPGIVQAANPHFLSRATRYPLAAGARLISGFGTMKNRK